MMMMLQKWMHSCLTIHSMLILPTSCLIHHCQSFPSQLDILTSLLMIHQIGSNQSNSCQLCRILLHTITLVFFPIQPHDSPHCLELIAPVPFTAALLQWPIQWLHYQFQSGACLRLDSSWFHGLILQCAWMHCPLQWWQHPNNILGVKRQHYHWCTSSILTPQFWHPPMAPLLCPSFWLHAGQL